MPLAPAVGFAAFWLIAFVIGHFTWMHVTGNPRYSHVIVSCFSISIACYLVTMAALNILLIHAPLVSLLAAAAAGLFLMACAFIFYMPFVFVVSSSLSVDTIILLENKGGALPKESIYGKFVSIDAVARRFGMMQTNGLMTAEHDRYFLTPKSIRIARFFTFMKHLWKLWPGG